MLRKFRERMESEKGFTLIELLVVILIIGILAAIALPVFLGQRSKGQDADAKSNARNLVSHVESHFATEEKYTGADTSDEVVNSGITLGTGKGEVTLAVTDDTFTIEGQSESGNKFKIAKATNGTITRTCTTPGDGACPGNGKW